MAIFDIYRHLRNNQPYASIHLKSMSSSINLSLTEELRTFVNQSAGDKTSFATPSEYLRHLIREDKDRQTAAQMRDAIIEGFQDAIAGRMTTFSGDLRTDMKAFRQARTSKSE